MPPGTPFNSFILPYPIRVDDFVNSADLEKLPLLHLLSHTHSDHINGLSAKSFASRVICSQDAKQMLLRHEVYAERDLKEKEIRAEKIRTFQHLQVDPLTLEDGSVHYTGSRDLLVSASFPYRNQTSLSNGIIDYDILELTVKISIVSYFSLLFCYASNV